jgi:hypothetical protein
MRIFSLAFNLITIKAWHMELGTGTEHEFHIVSVEILLKVSSNQYGGS